MADCMVCERIDWIKDGKNPYFVRELETGYVVLGDHQHFRGYTLFLCKQHATELHQLEPAFRMKFLAEMSLVAEAVWNAFQPEKLNYELLGAGKGTHMHWHIFPRRTGDTPAPGPVWQLGIRGLHNEADRPDAATLVEMCAALDRELTQLTDNQ